MAGKLHAYVNPPVLVPATPDVGESVSVQIVAGECDGFIEFDGYPILEQSGNEVHLTVFRYNYANQSPYPCDFPEGTDSYALGSLPQGNYTVKVDRVYPTLGGNVTETLAVLPLVVGGGGPSAAALPVLGSGSMIALIVFLALIGCLLLKHPRGRALPLLWIVGALNLAHAPEAAAHDDEIHIEALLSTESDASTPQGML